MSKRKNVFTRIGRPPAPKNLTPSRNSSTGERQGRAPSDGFDSALPASAFARGGKAYHHDDPRFCKPKR